LIKIADFNSFFINSSNLKNYLFNNQNIFLGISVFTTVLIVVSFFTFLFNLVEKLKVRKKLDFKKFSYVAFF
ncbi:hypothetical protein ACFLZ1_04685, partial [Patescibacteria group bacterium]